jgi:thymidylate synthase
VSVSTIVLDDLRNGYVDLLVWLTTYGQRVTSRGLSTVELTGVTLEFPDPTRVMLPIGVNRNVNLRLAAVEALQLLSGTADADLLLRAAPSYHEVLVRPENLTYGAYGPRLRYQLDNVISVLRREPGTRRAVLTIWREDDLTHDGDRPCTLTLQLLARRGQLELVVTMRSQDAWLGVPYDVFMFSQLQESLAAHLGLEPGRYAHHVGSLHLYDRDREAAGMLLKCAHDRPGPVDYPRGVLTTQSSDYPTEVAGRLLDGTFGDDEARLNPWYLRQLAQLGVVRRREEDL